MQCSAQPVHVWAVLVLFSQKLTRKQLHKPQTEFFLAILSKANRLIIIYSIKCRSHHSPNVVGGTSPGLACC